MSNTTPDENTMRPGEARKELAKTRRGAKRTDEEVTRSAGIFAEIRKAHETNHFREKFSAIIKGAA